MTAIKKIVSILLQCMMAIEVLILVGCLPVLFQNLSFNGENYLSAIFHETIRIFTLDHLTYEGKVSLFPFIFYKYLDSMRILGLGVLLAGVISLLFAYFSVLFFHKKIHSINRLIEVFEAVPDLLFILLLQMLIIFIYKKTGILIVKVVTVQEKTILLPVISLAIPISFYITKVIIHYIDEELEKDYIIFAKSKGFSFFYILNLHVLRNISQGLFVTSRTIFWSMLSTLLIIDHLFNMNALMITMASGADAFIVGCILIFIPFFILYRIFDWVSFNTGKDTN